MSETKIFNVPEDKPAKLAILIDADNASARDIKAILEEATKFGEVTVKRIYGNFVAANSQWKQVVNEYAIKPMQQFAFTTGKNATDGFMIIDAMDLLYTDRFDGFCIVSSDSDFTALAIRLKEQGVAVYGFGKNNTPLAFIHACSRFIYVENLLTEPEDAEDLPADSSRLSASTGSIEAEKSAEVKHSDSVTGAGAKPMKLHVEVVRKVFDQLDEEWVTASALGSTWKRLQVDFDPRTYGCKKLTELIRKCPKIFQWEMRKKSEGSPEYMYVKLKPQQK